MTTKLPLKELTLPRFDTDAKARRHLESVLWKDGIVCPHCQCKDQTRFTKVKPNPAAGTRAGLRWCSDCQKPFTVTVGTMFEGSKLPLRKWLIAWYMLCSSKKGISSLQLQRILELGAYSTALLLARRIRHALRDTEFAGKLDGIVEADERFVPVGGTGRTVNGAKPSLRPWANEPLKFAFDPDEALRHCAYNRLPTIRRKSVKTRLKPR
jgi:transposase-like protein